MIKRSWWVLWRRPARKFSGGQAASVFLFSIRSFLVQRKAASRVERATSQCKWKVKLKYLEIKRWNFKKISRNETPAGYWYRSIKSVPPVFQTHMKRCNPKQRVTNVLIFQYILIECSISSVPRAFQTHIKKSNTVSINNEQRHKILHGHVMERINFFIPDVLFTSI